jgi:hypothetical protein
MRRAWLLERLQEPSERNGELLELCGEATPFARELNAHHVDNALDTLHAADLTPDQRRALGVLWGALQALAAGDADEGGAR